MVSQWRSGNCYISGRKRSLSMCLHKGTLTERDNSALGNPAEVWDLEPLGTRVGTIHRLGRNWKMVFVPGYECPTCADSLEDTLCLKHYSIKTYVHTPTSTHRWVVLVLKTELPLRCRCAPPGHAPPLSSQPVSTNQNTTLSNQAATLLHWDFFLPLFHV